MAVRPLAMLILALALGAGSHAQPSPVPQEINVNDARSLPAPQLARALLGERLGSRVIEAVRHEYESSNGSAPLAVDFYTQPELPWPRINRICRTDVITVEYDWFDMDGPAPSTPIHIFHVEATSRYKAFPMPPGEPGSPENDRAQQAACANFRTALDAFRAPSTGDAQWLAAIEEEYLQATPRRRFNFTCRDYADVTCAGARQALTQLALNRASEVALVDCPGPSPDQINYCYRLVFPYRDKDDPEWAMTVVAGMRDGMAPVKIRSLRLDHLAPPIILQ